MTSFAFIVGIIVLFLVLMAFETEDVAAKLRSRQTSLLAWLMSGNWPAKIGSILLIIGIGALLRYALVNIDVSGQVKLSVGVLITALFGYLSYIFRELPRHRALHLALAGATCGVAYLTAYSAYGFFGYLDNITGITLLVIVSGITGAFAIASNAVSIAVLAMIGAFMAPAFGIKADPGPLVIYSYYIAITILCLLMIVSKGWRPLIHLSFLFTLAGGLFLGWTAGYYQPEYYHLMQPIILILVTLHIAMPIMEQRASNGVWSKRFDQGYFIVLPITAAILTYVISPQIRPELSIGLLSLGLLWTVTAGLQAKRKQEAIKYAIVAFLFYIAAALSVLENVSFSLFGIFCMTVILTAAVRLNFPKGVSSASSFLLIMFIGLWFMESGFSKVMGQPFNNVWFWEHIVTGVLIFWAAYLSRQRSEIYKAIFYFISGAILLHAVFIEIFRLQFVYIAEVIHILVLIGFLLIFTGVIRSSSRSLLFITLALILFINSWIVASDAVYPSAVVFALLDILVLTKVAYLFTRESCKDENFAIVAILCMPLFALPWLIRLGKLLQYEPLYFLLFFLTATIFMSVIFAHFIKWSGDQWENKVLPMLFLAIALLLAWSNVFNIERGSWPVLFELTALTMLIFIAATNRVDINTEKLSVITIVLSALVLQAMLLRVFGPAGVMTIADISQIKYPTVVSLIWAGFGGAIAWWGGRISSRMWWSTGSCLMVVAAIKLVFIDFGSLGELGNIIGLIAAGIIFIIVAWLVPIPPKKLTPPPAPKPAPTPTTNQQNDDNKGETQYLTEERSSGINLKPVNSDNQVKPDEVVTLKQESGNSPLEQPEDRESSSKPRVVVPIIIYFCVFIFLFWLAIDLTSPPTRKTQQNAYNSIKKEYAEKQRDKYTNEKLTRNKQQAPVVKERVETKEIASDEKEEEIKIVDACTQFKERLPSDYILYAGGEYKGKVLDFQIDQSGHQATQFDVYVNEPGKNVVLALGAYEPSIWNIKWTTGTTLAGVLISGYHRQEVAGIDDDVPVLNTSYDNNSTCGYFYISRKDSYKADGVIRKILGQSAHTYYIASGGKLDIGQPATSGQTWQQNKSHTVANFRDKDTPLAGKAGIEQLINEGKLRPATPEDLKKWEQLSRHTNSQPSINIVGGDAYEPQVIQVLGAYVVLAPMRYPAGLYGAHSVTFIISEGVPRPEGNPGHSAVLDMNFGTCSGALCSK